MEEQKGAGQTSNSASNNTNDRSQSDNNFSQKATSSSNSAHRAEDSGAEDSGWWDCSLCTYKNSTDKFKCEICDLRRGTSTRKPRCNADTSVDLVMKQQEQIRQQTIVKTPKSRAAVSSDSIPRVRSKTRLFGEDNKQARSSRLESQDEAQDFDEDETNHSHNVASRLNGDNSSSESVASPKPKKKRVTSKRAPPKSKRKNNNDVDTNQHDSTDSEQTSENTDYFYQNNNSPELHRSESNSSIASSHYSSSGESTRSSSAGSPEPTTSNLARTSKSTENPYKLAPLEVEGNLIKYSPPTSSGRTGLIIDKKRFTQHSVTVNDVTITFTEFATRQNKYIRKKKKQQRDMSRPKNGNGKSRTSKEEAKSTSNNPTTSLVKDS